MFAFVALGLKWSSISKISLFHSFPIPIICFEEKSLVVSFLKMGNFRLDIFSDLSFLKILTFSTVYGRFKGRGGRFTPPPNQNKVKFDSFSN